MQPTDWIRLHLATLYQPELQDRLLERFGSVEAVTRFLDGLFSSNDTSDLMTPRARRRVVQRKWHDLAAMEWKRLAEDQTVALFRGQSGWPPCLDDLPQMPLVLFCRGDWADSDSMSVGIVGTRRPSPYGIRQARRFARELAAMGITVVSGLARGIDGEAHRATLAVNGRTVAVLGSGVGRVYPRENRRLAETIVEQRQGVVVSEFAANTPPLRHHFPQRNRILSALSCGLLVIEAGEKSGSLITVDWTLRYGRPVFVVPGRVEEPQAAGCLSLIQSGAEPVGRPEEIAEALFERIEGIGDRGTETTERGQSLATRRPFLTRVLDVFRSRDRWHPNDLCTELGLAPCELVRELTRLESEGLLERAPGGVYILVKNPREPGLEDAP